MLNCVSFKRQKQPEPTKYDRTSKRELENDEIFMEMVQYYGLMLSNALVLRGNFLHLLTSSQTTPIT